MIASALVAGCVAFSCQAGRSELLTAAARYSELLVQAPPGADRPHATRLSVLVEYLQNEAWALWVRRARGANPEENVVALVHMLQVYRDAMHTESALSHPHGIIASYRIQSSLLNALERECERTIDAFRAAGRSHPGLTGHVSGCRERLRVVFASVLARIAQLDNSSHGAV
jgi:hypothetical protein